MNEQPNKGTVAGLAGDALLDRAEVGALLSMTPRAIAVAMCRGRFPIPVIRLGRRVRFRLSDVRRYIENANAGDGGINHA